MSSGCGDVLSLADLQTAKKHQIFEAEVITGKSGGVAGGADIDYATNQVTGQTQKTLPAILRDLGFRAAAFTFTTGGTLAVGDTDVAVLWPVSSGGDGDYYRWKGAYPKTIPANSTPASTGGVSNSAWMPVGDITLRTDLASTSTGKGSSLVAYKGALADEVNTTLKVFADPTYLLSRWGAVGDGVTDDSAAIQKAINAMPDVGTLIFDKPSYVVSNVTISKGVTLLGSDFSQSGVHLINNHATNPTFKALSINNIKIDGFYFDSSVTRVSSATGYLDFTTCHRVTVQNSFFWEYFLAVSFDGGTEINFDTCEGFTTKSGTGSGFAWFGKNNYTGSINIVNCYLKVDDSTGSAMPEFGIRLDYVDVAYIDGSTTIIRHGRDVMVTPDGTAPDGNVKFAHLIKIVGGILDTAKSGIFVQPANGADAEVEMVACYSAAQESGAWVFDGTLGKVTATITGGQVFSCGVSALDVIGANATVFVNGTRFANNQIGLHVTENATVYASDLSFGDWDNTAGNQFPYSIDATAKGHLKNPVLRNNFNAGVNLSTTFDVCDLWLDYAPTVTSVGGTIGPVTVASSRYKITNKSLEFEIAMTITAATSSGGIVVSLPRPPRTHLVGIGRNVTAGPMLQCAADPTNTNMLVVKYDNTHPVVAAGNVLVARTIYEIN